MGNPPHMPQLRENLPTRAMHGVSNCLPPRNLLRRVNTWRPDIADTLRTDLRSLGDDQPGGRALSVIRRSKRIWNVALERAAARHRRHYHAVGKFKLAQSKRREKAAGPGLGIVRDCGLPDGGLVNGHCEALRAGGLSLLENKGGVTLAAGCGTDR